MNGFETVLFGRYPQTADGGVKSIEWLVLKEEDRKLLVISRYGLYCRPYHDALEPVTWENCDLRRWLNADFLRTAFTEEEQQAIPAVTVAADANPKYGTDPGNPTRDCVFLLSVPEAERCFLSRESGACQGTEYCCARGTDKAENGNCWWWQRSPGYKPDRATYVSHVGLAGNYGLNVNTDHIAVRPALWLDPESQIFGSGSFGSNV